MATLRANNVGDSDGTTNPITLTSAGALTATWPNSPANMPAVVSPDILKITVEPNTPREEILYITAYTVGATSATVLRAQEGLLPAAAHVNVAWVHAPTASDFPGPAGPQGPPGAGVANPLTSVGDMIVGGTGGTQTRLGPGSNTYQLTIVSGTPGWVAPAVILDATHSGTYVGAQVGAPTGAGCVLVGFGAGQSNSSGWNNTFIGYQAGNACTTGNQNAMVGYSAGAYFVTGTNNTALGYDAGVIGGDYSGTTGVGASAQVNGANGTSMGYLAFAGSSSIAIGYNAQGQVSQGVVVGPNASVTAGQSVAVGSNSNVSGTQGVAVGYAATVPATNSVAIGYSATVASGATLAVALGAGASVTKANQLALGQAGTTQSLVSGLATRARVASGSISLGIGDCVCLVTSNSAVITLPGPATAGLGAQYIVKAAQGVSGVSIHPNASETIDTFTTYGVATGGSVQVVTDGTNWYVLNATMAFAGAASLAQTSTAASTSPAIPSSGSVLVIQSPTLVSGGIYLVTANILAFDNLAGVTGIVTFWLTEQPAGTLLGGSVFLVFANLYGSGSYTTVLTSTGGQASLYAVSTRTGYNIASQQGTSAINSSSIKTVRIG